VAVFRAFAQAVLTALALFDTGCARAQPDPVVLALGNQVVRRSDFERHVKSLEREGPIEGGVRRALFESFVEERVLVLEARERGFLNASATSDEEQEAVRRLLLAATPASSVSEVETAAYFEAHQTELAAPETVTLHQILLTSDNEARDVRRRLQKDPKSFEVMARSASRGPEASTGGLMGTFGRGQLPAELETAAFSLAVGGHSEPIQTPLGFHVLRVDSRQTSRPRTLDECRQEIQAKLAHESNDRAVKSFVQELLARAKVNHEAVETRRPA